MPYYPPDTYRYVLTAPDRGYLAESFPIHQFNGTTVPATAGRLEFAKVKLPKPSSVTNVVMVDTVAGGTLTAGQCFAALYTEAGVLVGVTADQKAAWEAAAGIKTMALASGPFACAAGNYYVAFWHNGTTAPTWIRGGQGATSVNAGTSAPTLMFGSADTGLTTTPPSPMGAQTARADAWWVALS